MRTGRHCWKGRPLSRTGENSLYGISGGAMETAASEKPGPRHRSKCEPRHRATRLTKGNSPQQNMSRTQTRQDGMSSALERIGEVARRDKKVRFTALMHHVYNLDTLWGAYFGLKRDAAPGVDGETWQAYGEQLEKNLSDLSERLKRGAYQAKPVRRVLIPKADGGLRPPRLSPLGE